MKAHLDTLHGGPNQVMAQIKTNFSIPINRSVVRQELTRTVVREMQQVPSQVVRATYGRPS